MNTRVGFYAVVALQLGFLASMGIVKQYERVTGEKVVLEVVPVDPRDFFRGDYVVLGYNLSRLERGPAGLTGAPVDAGQTLFVTLEREAGDRTKVKAAGASLSPPARGTLFLRGRVTTVTDERVGVEYGIEQYFVPERRGREIEVAARERRVTVEVSITAAGDGQVCRLLVDGRTWGK
ncbi:MAG: GDYXXLXY domain-containing protein [Planctomycetes bacterium]|nr:GDYXXLXY domain-containing protein [Planctomycetota bacterium]